MTSSQQKKRRKLHEISLEQDIKYRGPLSYRAMKIAGWVCIAVAQLMILITLFNNLRPGSVDLSPFASTILQSLASLPVPLFILANFSLILNSNRGYKLLLLTHGLAAAGIIIVFLFLYLRYGVGIASAVTGDKASATQMLDLLLAMLTKTKDVSFNFFVDFFLCTLFMFFLHHRPSRFFTEKKLWIFRAFVLLPLLYEVASLVLKYLSAKKVLVLPVVLYPFLTTKPLPLFVVFIILALFIKYREFLFCKNGRTHQEYQTFLKTNRNSLHFSIFAAIVFLIAGLVDLILFTVLLNQQVHGVSETITAIRSLGLGGDTTGLILLAPFVLLFSYTRKHKSKLPDYVIPVAGIVLVILVYLEGIYQAILTLLSGG